MNKLPERYKGSFWSLSQLREHIRKQIANVPTLEEKMDKSNQERLEKKRKQEEKLQRPILYPANGDAKLRGIKGNNGIKLVKRLSY